MAICAIRGRYLFALSRQGCLPGWLIIELAIWELPGNASGSKHTVTLHYGIPGTRIMDMTHGEGNHKHSGGHEKNYLFSIVEQLMADFLTGMQIFHAR